MENFNVAKSCHLIASADKAMNIKKTTQIFYIYLFVWVFIVGMPMVLPAQENLSSMGLIDSVLSVREITYSALDESEDVHRRMISSDRLITFDVQGNILEMLIYQKGRLYSTLIYHYDSAGFCTGFKEIDAKDRVYLVVNYEYSEDGWLQREIYDRSFQKLYDDRRKEIDVEYHEYYRNLFTVVNYRYNLLNLVTKKEFLRPGGDIDFVHEYTYGIKRYVNRKTYVSESGDVSWYEKIKNNLEGWPIEVKRFESSRMVFQKNITYETDSRGNWISREETTEEVENVFGDPPKKTSEITIREIEYY